MTKKIPALQRQSLPEQVAREIGLRIMRDDFQPGEALAPEAVLGVQLRVSRSVVREALKLLSAKRLIEARPKLGSRVRRRVEWNFFDPDVMAWQSESTPDSAFLLKMCEGRLMFEPMTAGLAAKRATDEELTQIARACVTMEETVDTVEANRCADLQFHMAIGMAAHDEFLSTIFTTLETPLRASRLMTSPQPGANRRSMPAHQAVNEALIRRDSQAAEEAMRQVIHHSIADIELLGSERKEHKKEGVTYERKNASSLH